MIDSKRITIQRSFRKTISLHVLSDGSVMVKAPIFVSSHSITRFIEKHTNWIEKRVKIVEKRSKIIDKRYISGEKFLYLGNTHTLRVGDYPSITLSDSEIFFPKGIAFRIQKELTNWYIKQAKVIITERVQTNAADMHVQYRSIMFSDTKSKWGSCSPENNLQFNWRLVMAPIIVLNYVVIHELVHTIEKNHSARFWRKVEQYNPSYRQQRKWLKTFGETLVL